MVVVVATRFLIDEPRSSENFIWFGNERIGKTHSQLIIKRECEIKDKAIDVKFKVIEYDSNRCRMSLL